eukprot:gene5264-3772_t
MDDVVTVFAWDRALVFYRLILMIIIFIFSFFSLVQYLVPVSRVKKEKG